MFLKSEMVVSNLKKCILGHILELLNLCLVKYESSYLKFNHCVKSVRIQRFSGPYSVRMRENKDQKNSEYGHFSRSKYF